jgi:hypothetical protein
MLPSVSQPYPLPETARREVMTAEAVTLCIGISVSTQKELISIGDLEKKNRENLMKKNY